MSDNNANPMSCVSLVPETPLTCIDPAKRFGRTVLRHGLALEHGDPNEMHHDALAELFDYVQEQDGGAMLPDLNNRLNTMVTSVFPVLCTVRDGKIIIHVHPDDGETVCDDVSIIVEAQRWSCVEIVVDTLATSPTAQLSNEHGDRHWLVRPVLPVQYRSAPYPTMMHAVDALHEALVTHLMREGLNILSGIPLSEMQRKVNRAAFAMLGAQPDRQTDVIGKALLRQTRALMGLTGRIYRED